jgi:hypothetical protein
MPMQAIGSSAISILQPSRVACGCTANRPYCNRSAALNLQRAPGSHAKLGASDDLCSAVRRVTGLPTAASSGSWRRATSMFKHSERFTANAKLAVKKAQAEGCKLGKNYAGPEHLLLGILAADDGLPALDQGATRGQPEVDDVAALAAGCLGRAFDRNFKLQHVLLPPMQALLPGCWRRTA